MDTSTLKIKIPEEEVKKTAKIIADEIADRLFYELLIIRYIPEIKAIKKNKIKALTDEEIDRFLQERIKACK